MKTLILIAILTLTGCASTGQKIIPLPKAPTVPTITVGEAACMSDAAWGRLLRRDLLRREYAAVLRQELLDVKEKLRGIIYVDD